LSSEQGFTLVEMMAVAAVTVTLVAMAIPQVTASIDRSRAIGAARYLCGQMHLARSIAISRSKSVALRFDASRRFVAMFVDGNRNGVRSADIAAGVDVALSVPDPLAVRFPGVRLDLTAASEILTFTAVGTATSATVYVTGRDGSRFAVRVLGVTARARLMRWDVPKGTWIEE
jgi:prepilin-type N-terminal cleavage/methylation domain-containing protein